MVSQVKFDRWQNTLGNQYSNIIQAQFVSWGTITTITTTYTYLPVSSGVITITPLYSNTRFIVMPNCQGYYSGATSGMNIGLSRTVAGVTTRLLGVDGSSGDSWAGHGDGDGGSDSYSCFRQYLDTPSAVAGVPITYQVLHGIWAAGTTTVNYASNYTPTSSITVLEIQP